MCPSFKIRLSKEIVSPTVLARFRMTWDVSGDRIWKVFCNFEKVHCATNLSCFSFFPAVSPEGLLGWQQFAVDLASVLSGLAKKPNVEHKTHFPLKVLFNPYHLLLFPCLPNSQQQDWWSCIKKTFLKRAFWWTGVDPRILLPKFSNHFCQNLSSCRAATLVYACPHVHMHTECTHYILYTYIYAVFTKNWY